MQSKVFRIHFEYPGTYNKFSFRLHSASSVTKV